MKHNYMAEHESPRAAEAAQPTVAEVSNPGRIDFAPSADEVARRAYFSYVNQGALPGHDVQHWLAAEAELIEERNLTRVHGFRTENESSHQPTQKAPVHEHERRDRSGRNDDT